MVADVKETIKKQEDIEKKPTLYIPSGATRLNLACSDNIQGAWTPGTIVNVIGDKSAGKTLLCLTALACIANNPNFDQYRLIHDDAERASQFDMEELFGKKTVERIEAPYYRGDVPIHSDKVTDFWVFVHKQIKKGGPFIYILDSYDSLCTDDDDGYIDELSKALDKEEDTKSKGGYKLQGPKTVSGMFRQVISGLEATNSLLIVISQVRENLNAGMFDKKITRSGGRALGHYCSHEIWLKVIEKVKNKKLNRVIGHRVLAEVTKNKTTGKIRNASFSTYYGYGVDDTDSLIEFMIDEGFWKKAGAYIVPADLYGTEKFYRADLPKRIEEDRYVNKLRHIVGKKWMELEEQLKLDRKKRFE